jgi:endo-1,4-beta-D-glucanase Y
MVMFSRSTLRELCISGLGFSFGLTALACSHNPSAEGSSFGGSVGSGGSSGASGASTGGGGIPLASGGVAATSGGAAGAGGVQASGGISGNGGSALGGSAPGGGTSGGASAAAGSSPAGGAGGAANPGTCQSGAPTPAANGANFPFPQRRFSSSCIYPSTCTDNDVSVGWQNYKTKFIVDGGDGSLRVQRPENSNDSVSEGLAYGMLFAVYLNDKTTFDKLWQYVQKHLDNNELMNWQINSNGSTTGNGGNSATDGDEDMAFALVMADKQWGGYASAAKDFTAKVLAKDFSEDGTVRGGDAYDPVNPSYLAPAFYRVFASYTGDSRWNTVLEKSYQILQGAANGTTGLVPDWSSGRSGPDYTYDAARTPYRVALDACWHDEPRAKAFSEKVGAFFAGVGVANIRDGFSLDGTITGMHKNSTFIGPAGVAGMVGKQTQLVLDAYTQVATDLNEGTESYYNMSWALFTALMMTGNFVNLGAM